MDFICTDRTPFHGAPQVSGFCRNPTLRRVWGWDSHSRNGSLGVRQDSWNFKGRLQGLKHLALRRSLYHWKAIKTKISKMGLHEPFGHLQHKLWQKERPGVKLAVWLPTTRSRELTWPRCVQVKCNTPLERSWQELQVCFRPHFNRRSEQKVMTPQSGRSPNRDSFRTPPWESRDKKPFECRCREEAQIILYGGSGGFPRVWAVVSLVSLESPVTCPSTKVFQKVI
jgi:hypothetical protein